MATTIVSGSSGFTLDCAGSQLTAQATNVKIDQKRGSESVMTFGGAVSVAKDQENSISCDLLYDGGATAGVYDKLQTMFSAGTSGAFTITGPKGEKWTGNVILTSVGSEIPADGYVKVACEFSAATLTFTPKATK